MIICPKCKQELEDDTRFCGFCGAKIEEEVTEAVAEVPAEAVEAPAEETAEVPAEAVEAPAEEAAETVEAPAEAVEIPTVEAPVAPTAESFAAITEAEEKKKGFNPKWLALLAIPAVALLLVFVIVIALVLPGFMKAPEPFLYISDGELYYAEKLGKKGFEVTEDLDEPDFGYYDAIQLSKDGKKLFYPDKPEGDNFTLYYRNPSKPKKDGIKIDGGVSSYAISEKGDYVVYVKNDDLHWSNLKKDEKVEKDTHKFALSADGKELIYVNSDGDLYKKKFGKDEVKIENEVEKVWFVSKDLKTVYFEKNENLYKSVNGKDPVKIVDDVVDVVKVWDSGEAYYTVKGEISLNFEDIIDDDLATSDSMIREPVKPNTPSRYSSSAWDRYWDDLDEYYDDYYEYEDKLERDELREEIKEALEEVQVENLYYYDGRKATLVAENFSDREDYAMDETVLVYSSASTSVENKLKMSDIESYYSAESVISEAMDSSETMNLAVKAKSSVVGEDITSIYVDNEGSMVYYKQIISDEDDEETEYNLCTAKITGSKLSKAQVIDTAESISLYGLFDGKVAYLKDIDEDDNCGDFYVNGKLIDSDVHRYSISTYTKEDDNYVDTFYYGVDYDEDDGTYTLKSYNGRVKELRQDVTGGTVVCDGQYIFTTEDESDDEIDIYMLKGKKDVLVAEDATRICALSDNVRNNLSTFGMF